MGAGCSSPLRRFGVKKSKNNRDSVSIENNDNLDQMTISARINQQEQQTQQHQHESGKTVTDQLDTKQAKLNLENEITIQSEAGEDHPSSASCYTDGKNHTDQNNRSSNNDLQQIDPKTDAQTGKQTSAGQIAATRMMGLGNFAQHDRHFLVSPALSPAPSICQSPAPNGSFLGSSVSIELSDLNEAFKTLTFGLPDDSKQKIKQPDRPNSELNHLYAHQLVQNHDDLTRFITVVFITTTNAFTTTDNENQTIKSSCGNSPSNIDDIVAKHISSQLKSICDENFYNLRFLNLGHEHLCRSLFVNNLPDVAMNIFEQEYRNNSERFIVIILANGASSISFSGSSETDPNVTSPSAILKRLDKRLLPTKIEAQIMNKLIEMDSTILAQRAKDMLRFWYNQVGNMFYLNPLYATNPEILEGSQITVQKVWQKWLQESSELTEYLLSVCDSDVELAERISLKSLPALFVDFITQENQIQKRTLLIRNYPQGNSMISNQQHQLSASPTQSMYKSTLSEIAKHLPDPNKLTLKRSLTDQEFTKTVSDWVIESFNKYIESFLENRITQGKFSPPFIERKLFVELTEQRHQLESHLDNITEGYEKKCFNFYKNQMRPILTKFVGSSAGSDINLTVDVTTESDMGGSKHSVDSLPSANHLVLISGPKGCGKTTLFSQVIRHTAQEFFGRVQIVYRYCGSTIDTLSPNRLLRSICEQFCQMQGENTAAASYIYSSRKDVMNSLNKSIKQHCVLFLDGINMFDQSHESSFDWLCELEGNGLIRIFLMLETGSTFYQRALNTYVDAMHISLDNPTISEWAQMLIYTARSRRLLSAANLYDEIKSLSTSEPEEASRISYQDVSDTLSLCHIRRLNNEYIYPELSASKSKQSNLSIANYKNVIHQGVLKQLHHILAPLQLCAFLLVIESSRNGLSEIDMIDIMDQMISQLQQNYPDTRQLRFNSSLLGYLKIQLRPWLRFIVCDKIVKLTVRKDFLAKALEYYLPSKYPKLRNEVQEILLDYYNKPFNNQNRSKNSSKGGTDQLIRNNISNAEKIWLDTQVSEITYLLIQTNPNKAKEYLMNKDNFYQQFLQRSNPEEFIEDYESLKLNPGRKSSQTIEDLSVLVNYIKQSIFPLRYDGSQIYSQIYCRSNDSNKTTSTKSRGKKINEIIAQASSPPIKSLLPPSDTSVDSFIKTRIGLNAPPSTTTSSMSITSVQSSAGTAQQKFSSSLLSSAQTQQRQSHGHPNQGQQQRVSQRIFTIEGNHRHVIVIYPDKNCLSVWDIFEEKAVRTINNIDQPRDLRMVDDKRAVVLCNRELRVYDLDSGQLLTKLKGVMNQKMPYFEVFGQDYVIALARNRMYVNMLNLNTGELETTFKVGEDRFLNSLLVSANGGICVCGDETQKPFPLLVWNLNERRLMHDLRLERHEFITRMSAISDDGHFVVSVCKQLGGGPTDGASSTSSNSTPPTSFNSTSTGKPSTSPNFIVIYDLNSGTLFKKWKPGLDTCAVAISISENRSNKVISAIVDSSILVWDLATGSKRHTLAGHSAPTDVMTVQNGRLFSMDSTCHDQSLRIWDIEEGYCLTVFSPDAPVSCCQLSTRGDALICGFTSESRLSSLVLCHHETVNDIVKRNKRRKSSKTLYIFDEQPNSRKISS